MATFSKRHYEKLAEALCNAKPTIDYFKQQEWSRITGHIAAMLASDNPKFDLERFAERASWK